MSRWIVVVTAEDGASSCYGAWRDFDNAKAVSDALVARSRRYTGNDDHAEFEVDIHAVQKWPGIRAWEAELDA